MNLKSLFSIYEFIVGALFQTLVRTTHTLYNTNYHIKNMLCEINIHVISFFIIVERPEMPPFYSDHSSCGYLSKKY